jgi:hypothetical protein
MRVRCETHRGADLSDADVVAGRSRSSNYYLTDGREYVVYGIVMEKNALSYLVEDHPGVPIWEPASFFAIVSDKLSRFWQISISMDTNGYTALMSFPEMVKSEPFYTELIDDDASAKEIYSRWKRLCDLEFPDPSIKESSSVIEGNWVQCPFCIDA